MNRARLYNERFPHRTPLTSDDRWIGGAWLIGAAYANPNPLYGAYPRGYLDRVLCMFPGVRSVLHAFSGGLTLQAAVDAMVTPGDYDIELVDLITGHGRAPTHVGDICDLPPSWGERFDLILADPPYSITDAEKYGTPMINRAAVLRSLRLVAKTGGHLVWLDTVWPMHSAEEWRACGHIALVRSTNHRVRLVSFFEAV